MRYFFSLMAFVVCASLSAQSLRINENDDFTGDSKKATTFERVGHNIAKLHFSFISLNETRALFAYCSGSDLGCCGTTDSYLMFKFTDGTTMKLKDSNDIDCEGTCQSLYIFDSSQWQDILTKDVEKMRVAHSDLYDDIDKGVDAGKIQAMAKMVD